MPFHIKVAGSGFLAGKTLGTYATKHEADAARLHFQQQGPAPSDSDAPSYHSAPRRTLYIEEGAE